MDLRLTQPKHHGGADFEKSNSGHKQLSYKVFMSFVDEDGNAHRILSRECYDHWVSTRKCVLKQPEESFRRVLTAHVGGLDGRRPFPEKVEQSLLKILRKREVWECFRGTGVSIGSRGYRNAGYHESLASEAKKRDKQLYIQQQQQHNQAMAAYTQQLQMQVWQLQQQRQAQHKQLPTDPQVFGPTAGLSLPGTNNSMNPMGYSKAGLRKQAFFQDSRLEQPNTTNLSVPDAYAMHNHVGPMNPQFGPQYMNPGKPFPLPMKNIKPLYNEPKVHHNEILPQFWMNNMLGGEPQVQPTPNLDLANAFPKYVQEQSLQ